NMRFTFNGDDVNGVTSSSATGVIYFTVDSNNDQKLNKSDDSVGLNTGDKIFYNHVGGSPIGGLCTIGDSGCTSNGIYYVIKVDNLDYQLADTLCHATASVADCGGSGHVVTPLVLTPDTST